MKIYYYFQLAVVFFLTACGGKNQEGNSVLNTFSNTVDTIFKKSEFENGTNVKAYVVIPNTGCSGCISSAETLLKTYITRKLPVRFLLTSINSYKVLKMKLGDSIVLNKNVYADVNNQIYKTNDSLLQYYPVIFYMDKSKRLTKYEYVEPDNPDALSHLYQHVKM
ncbi:MAG: hypothetical protein JWP69_575 [Flaviaesturariibacter sp.]|nr:hypothetical protein [Flaviaesturariibacter sp.]